MAEEITKNNARTGSDNAAAKSVARSVYGDKKKKSRDRRDSQRRDREQPEEFEQRIIDISRVTRVMAGGKRMRFRACVSLGNKKGRVGIGMAKGADVTLAVTKAVNAAKKTLINVPIVNETIPHEINQKYGASQIIFKPAKKGRGVIAGGIVRIIMELTGIKNITCKTLGSSNKINNAKCVIKALASLQANAAPKEEKEETAKAPVEGLKESVKETESEKDKKIKS